MFEVNGCATDRGGLCSLVVLGKCSKMGAFPALWWLFGGCATDRGGLCSLVVLGKCSKMGAFPALWWLFGTEVAGKCLKAPEKCRI